MSVSFCPWCLCVRSALPPKRYAETRNALKPSCYAISFHAARLKPSRYPEIAVDGTVHIIDSAQLPQ
jgi:hypothetical protein